MIMFHVKHTLGAMTLAVAILAPTASHAAVTLDVCTSIGEFVHDVAEFRDQGGAIDGALKLVRLSVPNAPQSVRDVMDAYTRAVYTPPFNTPNIERAAAILSCMTPKTSHAPSM